MKRAMSILAALACLAVGAVRWFELTQNTDLSTGYLLAGRLLPRYLLLLIPVVLIGAASLFIPKDRMHTLPGVLCIPAFCGMLFSGIIGICLYVLRYAGVLELVCALLLLVGSLWCAGYVIRHGEVSLPGGIAACAGWLLICGVLFCTKTASLYHLLSIVELMGSLGALLALAGLLRAAYACGDRGVSRSVFFRGLLVFYFATCLMLPQEIYQWRHNQSVNFLQGKSIAAGLIGLTGLACALYCAWKEGDPTVSAESPEEAFEAASRRLEEENGPDGAEPAEPSRMSSDTDALPDTRRAVHPQRWNSAASALYGPAPAEASEAPEEPEESEVPAQPAKAAPSPAPAPIAETSAPAPKAAEPARPAGETSAQPARPAGTMDRLDDLIGRIGAREPQKTDLVDDILSGMDDLPPIPPETSGETPAEPEEPVRKDSEKWVFHRK